MIEAWSNRNTDATIAGRTKKPRAKALFYLNGKCIVKSGECASAARGFTLIEMIGVMAIISILASAIVPNLIKSVMRARADQESVSIKTLAEDLQRYIVDNQQIPAPGSSSWSAAVASMSDLPQAKIARNENGYTRGLYYDPRFFTGSDTAFTGYTQQSGLTSAPVSPRLMLVSDLNGNAPSAPTTHSSFSAIWDQSSGASLIESDTVKITRLNLNDIFHRIILVNEHSSQPAYQLETGSLQSMPAAIGGADGMDTRFVIGETRINLYADPFPGGALDHVFLVKADENYRYHLDGTNWVWAKP